MIFIDTNVAIALRDGDRETQAAIVELPEIPVLSVMTRIELENGVSRHATGRDHRRRLLERMLENFRVEMFTQADILAYGDIVSELGYHRLRTLDWLIAAQAITRSAALITRNDKHFRGIARLDLIEWATPQGEGTSAA